MLGEPERFHVSDLASWLHSFPHVDFKFTLINDTFYPTDYRYRESLYLLASLPVIWLLLTLVTLSVYMCCRCCWCVSTKPRKHPQKTSCINWAVALMAIMCGILLALSYYGNEQCNEGVNTVGHSIREVNKTVDEVAQRIDILDATISNVNGTGINKIINVIEQFVPNSTVKILLGTLVRKLRKKCLSAKDSIDVIKSGTDSIHLDRVADTTDWVEFIRWITTIVILSLVVFVCLGLLLGIVKRSRGILISTVVMSVVSMVLTLAAAGGYFAINIGAADFCVDPDEFVIDRADSSVRPVLREYLTCKVDPYADTVTMATTSLTDVNRTVNAILKIVKPFHIDDQLLAPVAYLRQELKSSLSNVTRLSALVSCTPLHNDYVNALYGLCDTALLGMVFIMLSCLAMGIFISIMICLVSTAWQYYGKAKDRYESDDSDPFLPRPPPYNGYGTIPVDSVATVHDNSRVDVRLSNRSSMDLGASNMPPGGSPPPAYNHNRAARQYNISYRRVNDEPTWHDQIHHADGHGQYDDHITHATFNR